MNIRSMIVLTCVAVTLLVVAGVSSGWASGADRASSGQQDILEDGIVTQAEQNLALTAAVECLRGAGVTVYGPMVGDAHGTLTYSYVAGGSVGEIDHADDAAARCEAKHYRDVGAAWLEQLGTDDRVLEFPSGR